MVERSTHITQAPSGQAAHSGSAGNPADRLALAAPSRAPGPGAGPTAAGHPRGGVEPAGPVVRLPAAAGHRCAPTSACPRGWPVCVQAAAGAGRCRSARSPARGSPPGSARSARSGAAVGVGRVRQPCCARSRHSRHWSGAPRWSGLGIGTAGVFLAGVVAGPVRLPGRGADRRLRGRQWCWAPPCPGAAGGCRSRCGWAGWSLSLALWAVPALLAAGGWAGPRTPCAPRREAGGFAGQQGPRGRRPGAGSAGRVDAAGAGPSAC